MNTITLSKIIEAILLSSGRPLSEKKIISLFDKGEKPSNSDFKDALDLIEQNSQNNSFTLSRVASGFRLQVISLFTVSSTRFFEFIWMGSLSGIQMYCHWVSVR